jgi:hypothetical protein
MKIPVARFPRIWYEFAGHCTKYEDKPEEAINLTIAECLTLFE